MSKYSRRLLYKERAVPIKCELCTLSGHGTFLTTKTGHAHLICLNIQWGELLKLAYKANQEAQIAKLNEKLPDENLTGLAES